MFWRKNLIHGVRVYDTCPFGGGYMGGKGCKRILLDVQRTTKDHRHVVFGVILPNRTDVPAFLVRAETANSPDLSVEVTMSSNGEAAGISMCGRTIERAFEDVVAAASDFAPLSDPLNADRATARYRQGLTELVFELRELVLTIVNGR